MRARKLSVHCKSVTALCCALSVLTIRTNTAACIHLKRVLCFRSSVRDIDKSLPLVRAPKGFFVFDVKKLTKTTPFMVWSLLEHKRIACSYSLCRKSSLAMIFLIQTRSNLRFFVHPRTKFLVSPHKPHPSKMQIFDSSRTIVLEAEKFFEFRGAQESMIPDVLRCGKLKDF